MAQTGGVGLEMSDEAGPVWVCLTTEPALVVLNVGVAGGHVTLQIGAAGEALAAELALVLVETCGMELNVLLELRGVCKEPLAVGPGASERCG